MWLEETFIGLQSGSGETGPAIFILIFVLVLGFFIVEGLVKRVGKILGGMIQLAIGIGLMAVLLYIFFVYFLGV